MKVFTILLFSLLTFFSKINSQTIAANLTTIIKKADTLYKNQQLQEAITKLQSLDKINPVIPADIANRGAAYYQLCRYLIEKEGQQKTDSEAVKKYSSLALADFNKAIKARPKIAAYYLGRAKLYKDILQDHNNALVGFSAAIKLNPVYTEALANRVQIYEADKDYTNAAADYTKLIKLDSNNRRQYYEKQAICYTRLNNYTAAAADYSALISQFGNIRYYELRGDMYILLEKFTAAINDFTRCVNADVKNKDVRYKRARTYDITGNLDSAFFEYTNLKMGFDMYHLNTDIAAVLNKKYKTNFSKADMDKSDKFLDIAKNDLLWPFRFKTEEDRTNFNLIKTALENSIATNQYNYNAYFWLGELNYTLSLYDAARDAYLKANDVMPLETEFLLRAKKCLEGKKGK